jgi:hypothetical protein
MTDAATVNSFGALFYCRKRACLTLLVAARLADFHHLHAKRHKPFNPLVFMALAKLRPQCTQLVLEDNWPWQLTRCMLNVTPQRMAAERLCKEVALVEGVPDLLG